MLILLATLSAQAAPLAQSTAQNPIIWADVPDPSIIRVGNNYYMSSTTMHVNPGVPIMKSTNLINWEIVNYVYPTLGNGNAENLNGGQNEYGKGSWASSLRYKNGTYYVLFMSYTSNNTFVFQTTDIENGTWTKYALGAAYHDGSLLFDDDGRVFLVYGAGDIRVIELNADARSVKAGGLNKVLITNAGSIAGSGGLAAEGAHIFKRNGQYYIFLISWPSGGVRTQLVYKSSTIDGAYTGRVILSNPGTGVAQGGIVDTPSGQWYSLLFRDTGAVGRIPYLISTTWDANGWPVLGSVTNTGIVATVGSKIVACDGFDSGTTPGKMWQWNHNPESGNWSYNSARPGFFRLTNGSVRANIHVAKNTLTQRTFGPESSAIVAMETGGMKAGDYAGLSAFQYYYGYVGVKMVGTTKSIVMVRGSTNNTGQTSTPVEVASVPLSQSRVYFKVYTDFRNQTDKANFYYSLDGNTWTSIGTQLQMAYTLPHFMGYRFALFNYGTTSTGGYVDFDYFKLEPSPVGGCSIGTSPTPTPTRTPTISGPTNTPTATQPVAPGVVTRVRFFPRSTFANRMTGGIFQGSNTSTTSGFVNLVTITTQPADNTWSELNFSNSTAYRYLRYLAPNASFGNVSEIEFYSGATRLTGTGFGTAGAWNNGTTTFDKALDGNTTTFFDAATGDGIYVGIDTGATGPTPTRTPTPVPSSNFLTNADMEGGTTNWVVNGAGTLSSDTSQFHGGARSVKITGRTANWNGIGQNVAVSNFPTSGQNVTVSVWVRSESGTPTGIATLRLTASTTTYVQLASAAINSTGWTLITGTVPVSWSGTLTGVLFYVETAAGTDNIYIDDAQLYR